MESRLPIRICKSVALNSYHDDIEHDRILLLRKQRIINKLKLSKWMKESNVVEGDLKTSFELLTKNIRASVQPKDKWSQKRIAL